MILSGEDVTSMVSQLGAFGVAAMRLLPSANRINNYLTQISYFEPFFMGVSDNLQEEIHDKNVVYDEAAYRRSKPVDKLPLQDKIVLDDIVYKYPNSEVLIFDHAHMEIPAGKSVGIVGTSGAGKTTIVDIMLGLLSIQEGHILADGVEVRDHYESWLKNIGYIPQTIFMIDSTIRKNVAFGYADEDIDDAKVWEALKKARLDEFVRSLPEGLDTGIGERGIRISGGQRQRIGIARALAVEPSLIIADEPVSALDVSIQAQVLNLLNELKHDLDLTYIFVAHDLSVVEYISDRVGVMYLGNFVEVGEKEKIYSNPMHPYTQALLSAVPVPDPTAKRERILLEGSIPSAHKPPTGCKFHTRCPKCMECCKTQAPERYEVDDGHYVYCHLYDKERREQQK